MAVFPPDWQIYRGEDFAAFKHPPLADTGIGLHSMMLLDEKGMPAGISRISLSGQMKPEAHFTLAMVTSEPHPDLAHVALTYSPLLIDVTPPPNSTSTPWRNLVDLLKDRSVLPSNGPDQAVVLKAIIKFLSSRDKTEHGSGASLRWAITGTGAGGVQLELQALPSHAALLSKSFLKGDGAATILLSRIPLQAELFDGLSHAGPVPSLFAPHRHRARAATQDHLDAFHREILNTNNKFLVPDHMSLAEAVAHLTGPKPRGFKSRKAFPSTIPANTAAPTAPEPVRKSKRTAKPTEKAKRARTETAPAPQPDQPPPAILPARTGQGTDAQSPISTGNIHMCSHVQQGAKCPYSRINKFIFKFCPFISISLSSQLTYQLTTPPNLYARRWSLVGRRAVGLMDGSANRRTNLPNCATRKIYGSAVRSFNLAASPVNQLPRRVRLFYLAITYTIYLLLARLPHSAAFYPYHLIYLLNYSPSTYHPLLTT